VQVHELSVVIDAPREEVWELFWYRGPDRPRPPAPERARGPRRLVSWLAGPVPTRIEILHPGDEVGEGLVRHCTFPVPRWLLTGGVGRSWEWLTEVRPPESWRYDAVGKPLWSRATGWTRLVDLGDGRTRVEFREEYEAFNPVSRLLLERAVHRRISRDNAAILRALEGGVRWHRRRRAARPEPAGPGQPGRTAE